MSAPAETAVAPDAAPVAAPVQAPVQSSAPAHSSPISNDDLNRWKDRFNDVLSRPGDHINSKSPAGASKWATSLFDCFSPLDTCLITCCVPCVSFGKTEHILHKSGKLEGYEPVNTSVCLALNTTGVSNLD